MQTNGETGFDQATAPTYHAEVLLQLCAIEDTRLPPLFPFLKNNM